MKLFLEILTNPFGIATNIVHWTIAAFVFYKEGNPFIKKTVLCFDCGDRFLTDLFFIVNIIPTILIQIIGDFIKAAFGMNDFIDTHLIFLFIFMIITQWFLVGFLLTIIIDYFNSDKMQIPSIK